MNEALAVRDLSIAVDVIGGACTADVAAAHGITPVRVNQILRAKRAQGMTIPRPKRRGYTNPGGWKTLTIDEALAARIAVAARERGISRSALARRVFAALLDDDLLPAVLDER